MNSVKVGADVGLARLLHGGIERDAPVARRIVGSLELPTFGNRIRDVADIGRTRGAPVAPVGCLREIPTRGQQGIDRPQPLLARALPEPLIAEGGLGRSQRRVEIIGLGRIREAGAQRQVTRITRAEAKPLVDHHLVDVRLPHAVHRAHDIIARPESIIEGRTIIRLRGAVAINPQGEFFIERRERDPDVLGLARRRAEGPAINIRNR